MSSDVKQKDLRLAFGVHRCPKDAPAKVLRQVTSEAQALAVSMKAGGHKAAYIAAVIGRSESYISLLRRGKRPIPHRLVSPLCAATGSNLLAQYIQLERALGEMDEVGRLADLMRAA